MGVTNTEFNHNAPTSERKPSESFRFTTVWRELIKLLHEQVNSSHNFVYFWFNINKQMVIQNNLGGTETKKIFNPYIVRSFFWSQRCWCPLQTYPVEPGQVPRERIRPTKCCPSLSTIFGFESFLSSKRKIIIETCLWRFSFCVL